MKTVALKKVRGLQNFHFLIPFYQRGYRWNERQVRQLLQDIDSFQPTDKNFYFLQALVVCQLRCTEERTVDFDLQYPELERFIAQSWEKAFQLVQDAKDLQMQRSRKSSRIKP